MISKFCFPDSASEPVLTNPAAYGVKCSSDVFMCFRNPCFCKHNISILSLYNVIVANAMDHHKIRRIDIHSLRPNTCTTTEVPIGLGFAALRQWLIRQNVSMLTC